MIEGGIIQIAYVARDLETAMRRHWEVCGSGRGTSRVRRERGRRLRLSGKPTTHKALLALA